MVLRARCRVVRARGRLRLRAPAATGSVRSPPATGAPSGTTSATRSWCPSAWPPRSSASPRSMSRDANPTVPGRAGRHRRGAAGRRPGPPRRTGRWSGAFGCGLVVLGLVISNVLFIVGLLRPARRGRGVDGPGLVGPGHRRPRDQPAGPPPDDGALRGAPRRLPHRRRLRRRLLPPAPHVVRRSARCRRHRARRHHPR